jgi:hypothetical protein
MLVDPDAPGPDDPVRASPLPRACACKMEPRALMQHPCVCLAHRAADVSHAVISSQVWRNYLHWLVADIPGSKGIPSAGRTLVQYKGAAPVRGVHRCVMWMHRGAAASVSDSCWREL